MTYTIRQISELTGLTPHTLRYYDKEGLLPLIERGNGGYRHFSEQDLEWLRLVCCLRSTGMSVRQIKEFVRLNELGDSTLGERCEMLRQHKKQVEAQIAEMQEHLARVDAKIETFTELYREYLAQKKA